MPVRLRQERHSGWVPFWRPGVSVEQLDYRRRQQG